MRDRESQTDSPVVRRSYSLGGPDTKKAVEEGPSGSSAGGSSGSCQSGRSPHAAESVACLQLGGPSSVGVATRAGARCPGPNSACRASSRRSRPSVHAQWLAVHGVRDQTSGHETSPPGRAPTIAEPA